MTRVSNVKPPASLSLSHTPELIRNLKLGSSEVQRSHYRDNMLLVSLCNWMPSIFPSTCCRRIGRLRHFRSPSSSLHLHCHLQCHLQSPISRGRESITGGSGSWSMGIKRSPILWSDCLQQYTRTAAFEPQHQTCNRKQQFNIWS